MAHKIADWTIKLLALLVAATFVFAYWQRRDNGRYVFHAAAEDEGGITVIDTQTGVFYTPVKDAWFEFNPRTGAVVRREGKLKPN